MPRLLALEAGKPVLVEKPFAMNAGEASAIAGLAEAQGLFAMEAMWTRFLPHIVEIRGLLSEGALGEIVSVSADHGQWFAADRASRLFAPELGGGALLDLGVYPVSFASMVLGPPDRVAAVVDPAFTGVDGQVSMSFGYASGAQAVAGVHPAREDRRPEPRSSAPTRGSRSTAILPAELVRGDHPFGREEPARARPSGHGLRHQADEVARCIAAGLTESPVMPLAETVSIAATMDQVLATLASRPERTRVAAARSRLRIARSRGDLDGLVELDEACGARDLDDPQSGISSREPMSVLHREEEVVGAPGEQDRNLQVGSFAAAPSVSSTSPPARNLLAVSPDVGIPHRTAR